ncbi:YncE family protein [Nocardioides coralli]|uniref:YncE family protein n=1 Tax=Nocardioides coralli TaxID=2872154 RepID=UPI001CA4302A|nr:serine/threonine protein kinase [Nocardioides coralli]QZY29325.1 serine/threonine protein kinase [Nocardioides coralli]
MRARLTVVVVAVLMLVGIPPAGASDGQQPSGDVRNAVFVGNNWDGTATVLAPGSFRQLGRINIIPDREQRMQEIALNPERLAYFLAIREAIGEGNNQYVDDMYSSADGKLLIVSRPSYADVVAIRLDTGEIAWRFPVAGHRSDHMAISPNGKRVVVSASTANLVHVLRVRDGKEIGSFPSGGSPHESVFVDGGRKVLHASIGTVYTPLDQGEADPTKGERVFQLVDARRPDSEGQFEVLRRYDLRKKFDRLGRENMSTAVRPMTLSPDERRVHFQVSFYHGFVSMGLRSGRVQRFTRLPNLVKDTPREQYLLDSAHHGIALNPAGTDICVAGTMSDYATVVDARTRRRGPLLRKEDGKPYWVTPSRDGRFCYISWSGTDEVSRISYRTGRIDRTVPVGDHPQRVRNGFVARSLVAGLPDYTPPDDVQSVP